ncbi:MarR family transcriptional regulator [Photobacterium toruni]|uniref:MarR family transcriptional regulator n=1 Tax=Photobacterium toruni TaxID=1935446 RepID=UPI002E16F88D|nr:MarR family transcriptional regulator [Photobacterium toruni]
MRISHKRNVQRKLHKQKPLLSNTVFAVQKMADVELVIDMPVIAKNIVSKSVVTLTPKQQQVLDIVVIHADGLNPKGIGLQAGQEEAKAAAWATGALKKLTEEGLVERIQLAGNKVFYKAL